ncbi:MAG: hypothetical protein WBD20_06535 [Pirellulaceae bacterium]
MQYVNRRRETYFAFEGTTKTGKPKYFASKKPTSANASRAETLPADFEFFENPMNATVVIRRRRPTTLTVAQRNLLSRLTLEHSTMNCEVIIDGNSLIVYSSSKPQFDPAIESIMPGFSKSVADNANLEPGFKFTLAEPEKRLFSIARYCYRSSMEGWLELHRRPASMETLAAQYLAHLGQESYFDLI